MKQINNNFIYKTALALLITVALTGISYGDSGYSNVALGMPVTGSDEEPIIGELKLITDGEVESTDGCWVELGPFLQHVTIDLKSEHNISAIILWHFFKEKMRVYYDVIVQIANDPDFTDKVTIFNNDRDNSSGFGVGTDDEYVESVDGKIINAGQRVARYVRLYSNGNNANDLNHYIEVQVLTGSGLVPQRQIGEKGNSPINFSTKNTGIYIDPKSNFMIRPPTSWDIKEYPSDPRGKVRFQSGPASIMIIAAARDYSTFEELRDSVREKEKTVNIDISSEDIYFQGKRAIKREFSVADKRMYYLDFMMGSVQHNIAFTATTDAYSKFLPIVLESINTYEPFLKSYSDNDSKEHYVANRIRLAEIMMSNKDYEGALAFIEDGIGASPNNDRLLILKEEILTDQNSIIPDKREDSMQADEEFSAWYGVICLIVLYFFINKIVKFFAWFNSGSQESWSDFKRKYDEN